MNDVTFILHVFGKFVNSFVNNMFDLLDRQVKFFSQLFKGQSVEEPPLQDFAVSLAIAS